jgi:hypothetical protein
MAIEFDRVQKFIEITSPQTEVTIQDLINAVRDYEDEVDNMDLGKIADAFGKQDLGGGVLVGITMVLLNDWRIHFEDRPGPATIQVSITGGNLVATNSFDDNPIAPSTFTQVIISSSSSATLQELTSIQQSVFNNGVTIDVIDGVAGTTFPIGTSQEPSNNLSDARTIAESRGFSIYYIKGNITAGVGANLNDFTLIGENDIQSTISILEPASAVNAEFRDCVLSGVLDGGSLARGCRITDVKYLRGNVQSCLLEGPILLTGDGTTIIMDCWSAIPGNETPVIDMGGEGASLALRDYDGGIELINKTGPEPVSIDMNAGQVKLASSISSGHFVVRGVAKFTDLSTGTSIDKIGLINQHTVTDAVWTHVHGDDHGGALNTGEGTMGKLLQDARDDAEIAAVKP